MPDRPGAHASQIIVGPLKNGIQTLYAVWFCGTGEGHIDVGIMLSEITYDVERVLKLPPVEENDPFEPVKSDLFKYSEPRLIADMDNRCLQNPVPFIDKNGRFHLWYAAFYTKGSIIPEGEEMGRRDIFYQYSDDPELKDWSEPVIWSDRPGLWPRFAIVVLDNGTWLFPINDEKTYLPEYDCNWSSRFVYSYDEGKTWEFGKKLYSIARLPDNSRGGIIQPTVVQLEDGSLLCHNRSHTRWVVEMRSSDRGKTWTTPKNTDIPNPQCGVCLTRRMPTATSGGDLLLIYNPVHWGRNPISIAQSTDDGRSWNKLFDLRNELGELSYPSMVETPDGLVHCTYTLHRMSIAHDVFWLDKP
ncbi:MAG: exo-alpha-sialidase [Candidatus Hodarchaeota archaeon]